MEAETGSGYIFAEALWRSWKRKQTQKRLTLYGAGSGRKNILLLLHP